MKRSCNVAVFVSKQVVTSQKVEDLLSAAEDTDQVNNGHSVQSKVPTASKKPIPMSALMKATKKGPVAKPYSTCSSKGKAKADLPVSKSSSVATSTESDTDHVMADVE